MSDTNLDYDLVIEAGHTELHYWRDLWRYRELFLFLAWRDVLVRYKQTIIGIAWSVMRPIITVVIFTIVFDKLAKLPSGNVPYPILVYAATLPWQFFSSSLGDNSNCLVANANMLTKVYFPRLVIPASTMIVGLVDFLISFVVLIILMLWYHFIPDWRIIALPLFLLLALMTSFGFGLLFATLNVKYRDIRYLMPFIIQAGLYISPVGFSSSIVPENWRFLYSLNPMVGVIDGFRWSIAGGRAQFYWPGLILSLLITGLVLFVSLWYFRKTERGFADYI